MAARAKPSGKTNPLLSARKPAPVRRSTQAVSAGTGPAPLVITSLAEPRACTPVSDVYAAYRPQRIDLPDAKAHPTPLVESLAMSSAPPPAPNADVDVRLPEAIVNSGTLSEAQLETIVMAHAQFARRLPGKFTFDEYDRAVRDDDAPGARAFRAGYFIGYGTGCGKDR